MSLQYLLAERTLAMAEEIAWQARDWDTLSRLYMPLQEARRQRRQRCGEGIVKLDLWAEGPDNHISAQHILENFPHGQLLVAGWGSLETAIQVRRLAAEQELYVDTFLAATYPDDSGRMIAIEPLADVEMPPTTLPSMHILSRLRYHGMMLHESELPRGMQRGNPQTYGVVMALWERIHTPFLAAADSMSDPIMKIEAYRRVIQIDYACELAHQKLADVARQLCISPRSS